MDNSEMDFPETAGKSNMVKHRIVLALGKQTHVVDDVVD